MMAMEFEVLPVTRFAQNCSILWCGQTRRAAVIDPGGDLPEILNFIELLELEPEVALVTHGHFDHCGAAAAFAETTGARIEGPHRGDETSVRNLSSQPADHAVFAGRDEPFAPSSRTGPRGFTPDRWLEHGDRIRFGNEELHVLHCPGHTPGHVAYFSPSRRQAFVGDILFRHAIGAWEHPGGSLPLLIGSIRERLFVLGDDVAFVPGHGDTSTFGHERRENPFVSDAAYRSWQNRRGRT